MKLLEGYPNDPPAFELVEGQKGNINEEMERKILLRIDEILLRSRGQPMLVRSILDTIWSHSTTNPMKPTKEDVKVEKSLPPRKQKKRTKYRLAASLGGLPTDISLEPGRHKVKNSRVKEQDGGVKQKSSSSAKGQKLSPMKTARDVINR